LTDEHSSLLRELAHELRDALSPIRPALDLLRLRNFDAEASKSAAQRVERGLERALATIDAFVIAEQCENGTAALARTPASLQQLMVHAHEALDPATRGRCALPAAPASAVVRVDVDRSVQVLSSMMEQAAAMAVAATPIELSTLVHKSTAEVHVVFAVDAQASAPDERWFEGFRARGKGHMALRTARYLMRAQQGELSLATPAAGRAALVARFDAAANEAATMPARRTAAPSGANSDAAAGAVRVLIVDDSPDVRRAYREGLTALGYAVSEMPDAEQALHALAALAPRVALIDIHLPGMNGYQLARQLRSRGGEPICLVMLSGMTLDATMLSLSKSAGFDDCFDKAAGPRALHALLRGML
jgi:CheY-like chemotaxis protein